MKFLSCSTAGPPSYPEAQGGRRGETRTASRSFSALAGTCGSPPGSGEGWFLRARQSGAGQEVPDVEGSRRTRGDGRLGSRDGGAARAGPRCSSGGGTAAARRCGTGLRSPPVASGQRQAVITVSHLVVQINTFQISLCSFRR